MQAQWYGDKRDLVKWGTLIHLCKKHRLKTIIHIPMMGQTNGYEHRLSGDDEEVDFPAHVWEHFRNLHHIKRLGEQLKIEIDVHDRPFSHNERANYFNSLCNKLDAMAEQKIVFLDPDTGIEPKKAAHKHVKIDEIKIVWASLRPKDWLVLYQHALRKRGWIKTQRTQFLKACGVQSVKAYRSKLAHDVVFFAAEKLST